MAIITLAGFVAIAFYYYERLVEKGGDLTQRWFRTWVAKGVVIPVVVWMGLNAGISPRLPALMPEVEAARAAGVGWLPAFLRVTAPALLVIGSYWAALTLALYMAAMLKAQPEYRTDYTTIMGFWSLFLLPVSGAIVLLSGLGGLGFALLVWLLPIVHGMLAVEMKPKGSPLYSRAVAYIKFGKYSDAEAAVLSELEKSDDDFDGWMMLAELYAEHFQDLAEAERTVGDLCNQPRVTPSQIAVALHRLADWQLKLRDDPAAARRAMEEIRRRFPGTHLAHMAQLRSNQIPATPEALRLLREVKTIHLPTYGYPSDDAIGPGAKGPRTDR